MILLTQLYHPSRRLTAARVRPRLIRPGLTQQHNSKTQKLRCNPFHFLLIGGGWVVEPVREYASEEEC